MNIPLKIEHIGTVEHGVLLIHGSFILKDGLVILRNIRNEIDFFGLNIDDLYEMHIPIDVLEKYQKKYGYIYNSAFPFFHELDLQNVQNAYAYFADKYLPINQNIDFEISHYALPGASTFQRFWLYKKYLLCVDRCCISKDDFDYIKLKVDEFILLGNEEVTLLKNKVNRLKEMTNLSGNRRNKIPDEILSFILKRDSGECVACGSKENLQFDHILPVSKGGNDEPENLRVLCRSCNLSRGNLSKFI